MPDNYTCNVISLGIYPNNMVYSATFIYNDAANNISLNSYITFDNANNPGTFVLTPTTTQDTVNNWILTSPQTLEIQTDMVAANQYLSQVVYRTEVYYPFSFSTVNLFSTNAATINVFATSAYYKGNSVTAGQLTNYIAPSNVHISTGTYTVVAADSDNGIAQVVPLANSLANSTLTASGNTLFIPVGNVALTLESATLTVSPINPSINIVKVVSNTVSNVSSYPPYYNQ
jgi:hypothetical protein